MSLKVGLASSVDVEVERSMAIHFACSILKQALLCFTSACMTDGKSGRKIHGVQTVLANSAC